MLSCSPRLAFAQPGHNCYNFVSPVKYPQPDLFYTRESVSTLCSPRRHDKRSLRKPASSKAIPSCYLRADSQRCQAIEPGLVLASEGSQKNTWTTLHSNQIQNKTPAPMGPSLKQLKPSVFITYSSPRSQSRVEEQSTKNLELPGVTVSSRDTFCTRAGSPECQSWRPSCDEVVRKMKSCIEGEKNAFSNLDIKFSTCQKIPKPTLSSLNPKLTESRAEPDEIFQDEHSEVVYVHSTGYRKLPDGKSQH